jgi:heme-degrading monooxygenase HmoA
MIARMWTARATASGAERYLEFFSGTLVPQLAAIDGHRGAEVFSRDADSEIEITVLTFWESMESVTRFAGQAPERAVVEPEAQAVLLSYDRTVRHIALEIDTRTASGRG